MILEEKPMAKSVHHEQHKKIQISWRWQQSLLLSVDYLVPI